MIKMPVATNLLHEMKNALPLYCYVNKVGKDWLATQGHPINESKRLEVFEVHDKGDVGGIVCVIVHNNIALFMSLTTLDFNDNGDIDNKINEYKAERAAWVIQEEMRDMMQGRDARIKAVGINSHEPSRNDLCPCGSGQKYKRCCGK